MSSMDANWLLRKEAELSRGDTMLKRILLKTLAIDLAEERSSQGSPVRLSRSSSRTRTFSWSGKTRDAVCSARFSGEARTSVGAGRPPRISSAISAEASHAPDLPLGDSAAS